jgi:LppX/LprAFG-like lipoprotein
MVFAYPVIYMELPPESGQLPAGKKWIKMDLEKLGQEAGLNLDQMMGAGQTDPSQGLDFLRGVKDVHAVGEEEVRGVATTHYTGVVDLAILGTEQPEMKPAIDQLVQQSGLSRIPVEVWIDEDGFVRRMKQNLEGSGSGLPMNMTMTTDLYDFGTDVSVKEPPADDVVDFSELTGQS